ncbi:MAG TPA: HEAT repeat domain-containing protein [Cyclobacteriaceae bacterium]|nr:HEAT repeat domain-containing protein [Cyclobacteriaceae bacterium]
MLKFFLGLINIEAKEEGRPALLLLAYGFFMGVFMATYKVVAESLFMNSMPGYLDEAILISGAVGIVSTWLYTLLQKRFSFSLLAIINIIAVLSFIIFIFYNLEKGLGAGNTFIFILFLMLLPVSSIMLLSFWGLFGRIFDMRQSKRIVGTIDSGQLIATIIAFLVTPLLIEILGGVTNLLTICISSLVVCLLILFFLIGQIRVDIKPRQFDKDSQKKISSSIFGNNYSMWLAAFIAISVITYTFVDYSFLSVAEKQYPDENSLAKFLSFIYLAIWVFTLILQTFINEKLIATYGFKITLLILPIILSFFTIVGIFTGVFFSGPNAVQVSAWFFMSIVVTKFFAQSLREAFENPTFKLFFMPLNVKVRFDIQAKIEGVIVEVARTIAGTVIYVLPLVIAFKLIHYTYVLVIFMAGYFYLTGKLYNEYRNSVRRKLEKKDDVEEGVEEEVILEKELRENLRIRETGVKIFSIKLIDRLDSLVIKKFMPIFLSDPDKLLKKFALMRLNEQRNIMGVVNPHRIYKIETGMGKSQENKDDIGDWLNSLIGSDGTNKQLEDMSRLVHSSDQEDRIQALNQIQNNPIEEAMPLVADLMNDLDYNVRSVAIMVAGKLKKPDLYPYLIDQLNSSTYGDKAVLALIDIGEDITQYLEVAFFKTGQDSATQVRILKILEKIATDKTREALWGKIDFPDKKIVTQVLSSLAACGFKAAGYQTVRIKFVIESDINAILWNLSALDKIPDDEIGNMLKKAIEEENNYHFNHIYMLLSMIFDNYSINLVRKNLESKTSEGISFALELLDVLLTEDLKDRIIPLMDDISNQEKVRRLQVFYPHIIGDYFDIIKQVINKEFNQINRWTKALAIYWVGIHKDNRFGLELISNLFNPDFLIKESAAWSLYQVDPVQYNENMPRISKRERQILDHKILSRTQLSVSGFPSQIQINRILFLSGLPIFQNLPVNLAVSLSDYLEEMHLEAGEKINISFENNNYFYIVFNGYLNFVRNEVVRNFFTRGEMIGELLLEKKSGEGYDLAALSASIIFKIEKDKFYDILSTDHTTGINFLRSVQHNFIYQGKPVEQTA